MSDHDQAYDLAAVRKLLMSAFTAKTLTVFCRDRPTFRPIVDTFGPTYGLTDMVAEVITYCETHVLFEELLNAVKECNPRQYYALDFQPKPGDLRYSGRTLHALASALSAIPVPNVIKRRRPVLKGEAEVQRDIFRMPVLLTELLDAMMTVEPGGEQHFEQLRSALVILELLGVVQLQGPPPVTQADWERVSVSATSESSGYLVQILSWFLENASGQGPVIHSSSNTTDFQAVLESALDYHEINSHIILTILMEQARPDATIYPMRTVRVISVLVKAERINLDYTRESVYLHIKKPGWEKYALVGSRVLPGASDEDTARLALLEDLGLRVERRDLRQSGVEDEHETELSMSCGVYTRYNYNLFTLESQHCELHLDDLDYRWFTYKEICEQKSEQGQQIMTKPGLLRRIDTARGLDSVPVVMTIPAAGMKSLQEQIKSVVRESRDVLDAVGELARLTRLRLLPLRWMFLLLVLSLAAYLTMRPYIEQNTPTISNIADVLGIVGFIGTLIGMGLRLYKGQNASVKSREK